jgi:hypothetical protein
MSASRDVFVGGSGTYSTVTHRIASQTGFNLGGNASTTWRVPAFCTNFVFNGFSYDVRSNIYVDTTNKDSVATKSDGTGQGSWACLNSSNLLTLGINKVGHQATSGNDGHWGAYHIVSPIHTSSHYQSFETPFLKELVGGDRNMEQTNLVVTPDGKTWDEVTRKTDYLGFSVYANVNVGDSGSASGIALFNNQRGGPTTSFYQDKAMKGIVYGYDRFNILEAGNYTITWRTYSNALNVDFYIKINDASSGATNSTFNNRADANDDTKIGTIIVPLIRGDYITFYSNYACSKTHTQMCITKN